MYEKKSMNTRQGWALALIALSAMALVDCALTLPKYLYGASRREGAANNWVRVTAVVVSNDFDFSWRRRGERRIVYRYEFSDNVYISECDSFFGRMPRSSPEFIDESLKGPTQGARIEVLIDPANPEDAVRLPTAFNEDMVQSYIRNGIIECTLSVFALLAGAVLWFLSKDPGKTGRKDRGSI
jgi:hypothetical protein